MYVGVYVGVGVGDCETATQLSIDVITPEPPVTTYKTVGVVDSKKYQPSGASLPGPQIVPVYTISPIAGVFGVTSSTENESITGTVHAVTLLTRL